MISIESGGDTVKIIIPIPESEKKLVFETEEIRVISSLIDELKRAKSNLITHKEKIALASNYDKYGCYICF